MTARPTRRAVLLAGLAAPLAGCTSSPAPVPGPAALRPAPPPPPVDPDVALRAAAVGRERSLLQAYDAALALRPADAPRLAALRAEHVEHLRALGEPEPGPSGSPGPGSPTAAPVSSAPGAAGPTSSAAPSVAAAVPVDLAAAERAAAAAHAALVPRASRGLAAVLASLAASEASHVGALA